MMDPMLGPFAQEAATVPHQAPAVPWISTCTGHEISAAELADGAYWARQVRQPVLFGQALEKAFALPGVVLLEVGPGQALAQFARQHPARPAAVEVVASMPGVEGSDLGEESLRTGNGRAVVRRMGAGLDRLVRGAPPSSSAVADLSL
jgi:acyl transferase domain-containing protein